MIGAIIGDIVGSPYEFDRGEKIKDFGPLFIDESEYTDDSVMTIAVADGLMKAGLIYVISPIDLIPDFIPVIGYLDDAAVVTLVLGLGVYRETYR